jgi:hypothetical protein
MILTFPLLPTSGFCESLAEPYDVDRRVAEIAKEHNLDGEETRALERLLKPSRGKP